MQQAFSGTGNRDITNLVSSPTYILQGLSRVSADLQSNFATSVDEDFVYTYSIENTMDFSFSYILVGPRSQDVCGQCVEKYASNGNCLEACPVASYAYFYQTGGISCRRCSSKLGLTFNPATNSCQCATGYVNQTGTCNFIAASFINGQSGALSVNTGSGQVTPGSNVVSSLSLLLLLPLSLLLPSQTPPLQLRSSLRLLQSGLILIRMCPLFQSFLQPCQTKWCLNSQLKWYHNS